MKRIKLLVMSVVLCCSVSAFAANPVTPPVKDAATASAKAVLVDINSADAATLRTVPGIGEAYAKKIIAGRPYSNKTQIMNKAGIPKNVYDKIADKLVATQLKK